MSAHPLHIELPEPESTSVWPWLVALIAAACMLVAASLALQSIPASLQRHAQELIESAGFNSLIAKADGRDITIEGTLTRQQSVAALMDSIRDTPGVRLVRDQITIIDPEAEATLKTQQFLDALGRVNTSSVSFQPGSASFTAGSTRALDQLVRLMQTAPASRIRIEGHTDNTGPESVNLRLSRDRAQAVANYMMNRGISADRLIAKGYGSSQPIDSNRTDAGRSRNRRIEISYVN